MTWRWAARVLAVMLLAHAWFFASLRFEMVEALLFAPADVAGAGQLTCARSEGVCEPHLMVEVWLLILSAVGAIGLLVWSIWPRGARS